MSAVASHIQRVSQSSLVVCGYDCILGQTRALMGDIFGGEEEQGAGEETGLAAV